MDCLYLIFCLLSFYQFLIDCSDNGKKERMVPLIPNLRTPGLGSNFSPTVQVYFIYRRWAIKACFGFGSESIFGSSLSLDLGPYFDFILKLEPSLKARHPYKPWIWIEPQPIYMNCKSLTPTCHRCVVLMCFSDILSRLLPLVLLMHLSYTILGFTFHLYFILLFLFINWFNFHSK